MGKLRTANNRVRRNRMKARGHVLIRFNHGVWTWPGLHTDLPEGCERMVFHIPYEREQPNAYRSYRP